MATIVYQTNPETGVKYAYSSESYWDKDKKAPRSKRTYLGKVDPETGEIIKGIRKARKELKASPETSVPEEAIHEKDLVIARLEAEKKQLEEERDAAIRLLVEISRIASSGLARENKPEA